MAAEGSGGLLGLGGYGSDLAESSPAEVHLWDALSGDLVRRVRLPKVPPPSLVGGAGGLCAGAAGVVALVNVAAAAQLL